MMEQPEIKLCEVCWEDSTATQAYWYLNTIPVCDTHLACVCGRCQRRWATKLADDGGWVFSSCEECDKELERLAARRKAYDGHLNSKQWWEIKKELRKESFKEHGRVVCSRCGKSEYDNKQTYGESLHGHHRTYERFGQEKTEDAELLCSQCHASEHGNPPPVPIRGICRPFVLRESGKP
jgi:hypothetical protein